MRTLELLSPARDLECGRAAIDHGADAVYVGAERFGARAAVGNSVADIAELARHAHKFGARVYVTVNTIVYDSELEATRRLIEELERAEVDAILVQDMAVLSMLEGKRMEAHASTQTDNRTAEKVAWLRSLGFRRVVLARELSVEEIAKIHRASPDVDLEVFVHGALCVSYSGVCYASQHCFRRSANRGECAQFCRMKFDLIDADGTVIEHDRHLLSLKDFCQADNLERLAEAGATSFKIEGRLKDATYVKNVTAAYSQRLDELVRRHPDRYRRASHGHCRYTFTPNLHKTFNRGFTTYFADGRRGQIASMDTPKAMGEMVGTVKELRGRSFNVAGTATFANGDGLCFINYNKELEGFRVNRAEGNRLFPLQMPRNLRPGLRLYRNNDVEFERLLAKPSSERRIRVNMKLSQTASGLALTVADEAGRKATATVDCEHQEAQRPQAENIVRQLTKLGGTIFECADVELPEGFNLFVPSSLLAALRREAVERLESQPLTPRPAPTLLHDGQGFGDGFYPTQYPYLYNIANEEARNFYLSQGLKHPAPSMEAGTGHPGDLLMQCRHCLRYALGHCTKHGGTPPTWREPLTLRLSDGRLFPLQFNCKQCQMNVLCPNGLTPSPSPRRGE